MLKCFYNKNAKGALSRNAKKREHDLEFSGIPVLGSEDVAVTSTFPDPISPKKKLQKTVTYEVLEDYTQICSGVCQTRNSFPEYSMEDNTLTGSKYNTAISGPCAYEYNTVSFPRLLENVQEFGSGNNLTSTNNGAHSFSNDWSRFTRADSTDTVLPGFMDQIHCIQYQQYEQLPYRILNK
ncbi:uncharacterized protein LOC118192918 [Stegodyphus dumicola]|uniref:uncharacterized protein LOC118192918 n=1 Tax=Stegodyphus dumicola TaxID=202533 RepID=UPI0015A91615|nr:uncharacterized protein LOC118192918 [Stegodyphus dumicola]